MKTPRYGISTTKVRRGPKAVTEDIRRPLTAVVKSFKR